MLNINKYNKIPFEVIKAGFLNSEYDLNMYYSASDILVLPTLAENLPNTILESMASGTPVVGFKTGGLLDAITHLENGYLANHGDSIDLAFGINAILSDQKFYNSCRNNAIRQIVENFSLDLEISRFVELYKSIS